MRKHQKRLTLNRHTVADLTCEAMKRVWAGVESIKPTCLPTACCPPTEWTCPTGYPKTCMEN